jgi:hypothetical protein
MGSSVEPVPADPVTAVEMIRDGVEIGLFGNGMMEGGIKDGHLGNARTKELASCQNAFDVVRIVEGSEIDAVLDSLQNRVIDENGFLEQLPTVDHTVSDGLNVRRTLNFGYA